MIIKTFLCGGSFRRGNFSAVGGNEHIKTISRSGGNKIGDLWVPMCLFHLVLTLKEEKKQKKEEKLATGTPLE